MWPIVFALGAVAGGYELYKQLRSAKVTTIAPVLGSLSPYILVAEPGAMGHLNLAQGGILFVLPPTADYTLGTLGAAPAAVNVVKGPIDPSAAGQPADAVPLVGSVLGKTTINVTWKGGGGKTESGTLRVTVVAPPTGSPPASPPGAVISPAPSP